MQIFDKVISKHLPSKADQAKIMSKVNAFIEELEKSMKSNKIKGEVMLGGSAAKGTFLMKDFDVDVFVRFDYSYKDEDISVMLESLLEEIKGMKFVLVHGSRDYFQSKYKTINYEIIPVLWVEDPEKALNVTDMSPLHVKWLKKHFSEKLRREVILAKLFCKAQNVYGAESYIKGFSGHVLDILIVHYGSFSKLLKASQEWFNIIGEKNNHLIIDVENYKTADKLNKSKLSPLIVIDPIQPNRNAAAALSKEKMNLFVKTAKAFLENPHEKYFVKKEYSIDELKAIKIKNCASWLLLLEVNALVGKQDIVGAKLLKSYKHILKHLNINDFTIKDSGWKWDKMKKAEFWYVIEEDKLSQTLERMGPPLSAKDAAESFKSKHKKAYDREDRLYAIVDRPYRTPDKLIKDLLKDDYVKDKIKSGKLKVY
jgi:tRNA nucleotidyltransferase (CCA-adding enzyme)